MQLPTSYDQFYRRYDLGPAPPERGMLSPFGYFPLGVASESETTLGLYWSLNEDLPPLVTLAEAGSPYIAPLSSSSERIVAWLESCRRDVSEGEAPQSRKPRGLVAMTIRSLIRSFDRTPQTDLANQGPLDLLMLADQSETLRAAATQRAVDDMPEFGVAQFALGSSLRQQGDHLHAAKHLLAALCAPAGFSDIPRDEETSRPEYRQNWQATAVTWLHEWLRKTPADTSNQLKDPLLQVLNDLPLNVPVPFPNEVEQRPPPLFNEVCAEVIDRYLDLGRMQQAVMFALWQREWMACSANAEEKAIHYERIASLCEVANMPRHALLARDSWRK